jgi:hypothetical protein
MAVRDGGPAPFAFRGSPAQRGHLGIYAGLVDGDEPFQFEVGLAVELVPALLQQARALLLQCMCGLFLYVKPRERSHLLRMDRLMSISRSSTRRTTISSGLMSFRFSILVSMKAACASKREARFAGLRSSVSPLAARSIQRMAVVAATPSRSVHFRARRPPYDAVKPFPANQGTMLGPSKSPSTAGEIESEPHRNVTPPAVHYRLDVLYQEPHPTQ